MKKKILITGSNGFLGRQFIRKFKINYNILAIDNERSGKKRLSKNDKSGIKFRKIDIRNFEKLKRVVLKFKPEYILHLAAVHFIPDCENNPTEATSINVQGTINMLDLCSNKCKFIFASTAAVYKPSKVAHKESDNIYPQDIYGFNKAHCENYISYLSNHKKFNFYILRLFNLVGPGETNPHLFPEIFKQFKNGKRKISLGNTKSKRDYIHIEDVSDAINAIINNRKHINKNMVINIGTGKSYSVDQILNKISSLSKMKISSETDKNKLRKIDRPNLKSDISSIKKVFYWKPKKNIDDVIYEMINLKTKDI